MLLTSVVSYGGIELHLPAQTFSINCFLIFESTCENIRDMASLDGKKYSNYFAIFSPKTELTTYIYLLIAVFTLMLYVFV